MKKCLFLLVLTVSSQFVFAGEQKSISISVTPSSVSPQQEDQELIGKTRSKNGRCDCVIALPQYMPVLRYLNDEGGYESVKHYSQMEDCEYAMTIIPKCIK